MTNKEKGLIGALLISIFFLTACAPSEAEIQKALSETLAAIPTEVEKPTQIILPTNTPIPSNTPVPPTHTPIPNTSTPQPSPTTGKTVEEIRQDVIDVIVDYLEDISDIESITMVRFNDGTLEIEFRNTWHSQDSQPDAHFEVISIWLAPAFAQWPLEDAQTIFMGPDILIHLTSFSADGDYKYQSETDWETLIKVANKEMSYEEWISASNAGFR